LKEVKEEASVPVALFGKGATLELFGNSIALTIHRVCEAVSSTYCLFSARDAAAFWGNTHPLGNDNPDSRF
jgi:hypothetical protein